MKRIRNSLISLTLVFAMLLSFGIFAFADEPEATDDLIYTNVESKYLKYTLQEYVNSGAESVVFYSQRCVLSSGESGYCNIGYNKEASSFYIQVLDAENPNGRWCYKFDLDFVWKHRIKYTSDVIDWEVVDYFTIQFFKIENNANIFLSINELDSCCRLLFKDFGASIYNNVEKEYLKYVLTDYVNTNKSSEIFYSGKCVLSTGETGTCNIGYLKEASSFYVQVLDAENPDGRWCYKFDLDFVWKHRIEYTSDVIKWEKSDGFFIQFISNGNNIELNELDLRCRWLFTESDSNIYVSVEKEFLIHNLKEYVYNERESEIFYYGRCILSTGETGYCEIGYNKEASSFYILCRNQSSSYHRWCYKYDLDYVWKHRTEYISDIEEWEILDGFAIQFLSTEDNSNQVLNLDNLDPKCHLLFKESYKEIGIYYSRSIEDGTNLLRKFDECMQKMNNGCIFYSGFVILNKNELQYVNIGWDYSTASFYIQYMYNNTEGKWSYRFSCFDGEFKWQYQNIDLNTGFSDIEYFTIQFVSSTDYHFLRCPSNLYFMFSYNLLTPGNTEEDANLRPLKNGVYCFKNIELEQYMQINDLGFINGYSSENEKLELWNKAEVDHQKWVVTYVDDGYYTIMSPVSNKYVSVPSGSEDMSNSYLVQQDYNYSDRQLWKFTKTASGSYIIRPKSAEEYTTDWCMCAGDTYLFLTNVDQGEYKDDEIYKDEWQLEQYFPEINITVFADQEYIQKFSNYNFRIQIIMNVIKEKLYEEFGIVINYSEVHQFTSFGYDCYDSSGNNNCVHVSEDGTIGYHQNLNYIIDDFYDKMQQTEYQSLNTTEILFTGYEAGDLGMAIINPCFSDNICAIRVDNSFFVELSTACHEICHWLSTDDHYDKKDDGVAVGGYSTNEITQEKGRQYSNDCIYAPITSNNLVSSVDIKLMICYGCKTTIRENILSVNNQ